MDSLKLEDVLRQHIHFQYPKTSKGWYPVVCKVCHDHGRKGPRGAFIFDGDTVAYHCFNCGPEQNTAYDPNKHAKMPYKMRKVLEAWNIPQTDWEPVLLSGLQLRHSYNASNVQAPRIHKIDPEEIPLPDHFYLLSEAEPDDKWAKVAEAYLEHERGLDPDIHPFMLSRPSDPRESAKWKGRLIIPVYKDEKLIFYQGRAMAPRERKYMSPDVEKSKVLFGFDQLFNGSALPIFIVEGIFDALSINGVATIGNTLSDEQIQWLARSPREKVLIPDTQGDGHIMAEQALDQGWAVSIPDIGNCKDVNEAILKYGLLYTMRSITNNIATGFEAQLSVRLKCKRSKRSTE